MISVPAGSEALVIPERIRVLGVPPSTIQAVDLPLASTTFMWTQACGLIHSTRVPLPRSRTGALPSTSAAKAWCAQAAPPAATTLNAAPIAAATISFLFLSISRLQRRMLDLIPRRFGLEPVLFQRFLAQVAVHQLLHELDALELVQPRVLALALVEVEAHLPGPGEGGRVGDRGLVAHQARARRRPALDHLHMIGVDVAGPVEPGAVVHAGDGDHQGVAVPLGDRLPHPAVDRRRAGVGKEDVPHGARVLI